MATRLKEDTAIAVPQAPPVGSPAWFVAKVEQSKEAPKPIMEVIDLSANLAKFMLDVNADNRSIRQAKVIQYAADMAHGKWTLNGEPIIVSRDGNLNDGQHRCLAVVDSNSTVPVTVIFGVERETRLTVDQGAMRSASDFLAMEHVKNATTVASIARLAIAYERASGTGLNQSNYVTSAEVRERVSSDPGVHEAAVWAATNQYYSKRFAAGSLIGLSYYLLAKIHHDDARSFLEKVCRGDGLRLGDPAHTLREKLLSEGRIPRDRKVALIFRAWNFHRRGAKVRLASLKSELPFPALI